MARPPLKSRIVSALRRLWFQSEARQEALRDARISRGVYLCAKCGKNVPASLKMPNGTIRKVAVDHKVRVVPATGFDSWDGFLNRLFCEQSELQVLCYDCHHEKTQRERKESCKNRATKDSAPKKRSTTTSKKYTKCNQQSGPSPKPSRNKGAQAQPGGL